jgi:hypothetical protein
MSYYEILNLVEVVKWPITITVIVAILWRGAKKAPPRE